MKKKKRSHHRRGAMKLERYPTERRYTSAWGTTQSEERTVPGRSHYSSLDIRSESPRTGERKSLES